MPRNDAGQALNVLLAGDNGMLYVWGAIYRGGDRACQIVECLSVVELPVQVGTESKGLILL
jgi:hypothetical protein